MDTVKGETQIQTRELLTMKNVRIDDSGTPKGFHYPLFYDGVPKEFEKYAERELNETPENARKGMQVLKKYLHDKKMPDLEDYLMKVILRNCKYDFKKSIAKLEKFLKMRDEILEQVAELDLKKVEHILDDMCFAFLPYRDKFGRMILYTQPNVNFDLYDVEDAFVCVAALGLYLMKFPMTSMFGIVYIADCKSSSISLFYRILKGYKNYLWMWFKAPIRLQRIIIINENFLAQWFFNIIRPIVPSKIYQRISFHGENLKDLQEFFHPDILPKECGGNMGPLSTKFYRKELINFVTELKAEHQRKTAANI